MSSQLPNSTNAAKRAMRMEADAILALERRIGAEFEHAVQLLLDTPGKVVVTGLGKSGHVGRKIAATMVSTGTPACFVHSAEALHGDSGLLGAGDCLVAISNSGETAEVCQFAEMASAWGYPVIGLSGVAACTLTEHADAWLDISVEREADPLNIVPTTSSTVTLALGDALAIALMVERGFTQDDFGRVHPGGALGARTGGAKKSSG